MSWLKKNAGKFRFAVEIAVLLLLALYVTVQAGGLGRTTAAPANISLASATSTVPGLLNYQGYLTDSSGAPLDGSYAIKFAIYDAPTDGNELWSETQLAVEVADGQLSALLGESVPISSTLFATYTDTFIGVTVGSDPEMTPRQRIHSVPYAMAADQVAGGVTNVQTVVIGPNADLETTTATEFVDIPGYEITMETSGGPILLAFQGKIMHMNDAGSTHLDFTVDGVRVGGSSGINQIVNSSGGRTETAPTFWIITPSAGTHTFGIQWRSLDGGQIKLNQTSYPVQFAAIEWKQ